MVMTSCVPQINNHDVKHETVNRYQFSTRDQFSGSPTSRGGMSTSSTLRNMITRAQDHHGNREDDQLVLDLVYITERIISMSFPADGHESTYQYNINEVMNMLKQKHGDNCMVINVSEQRSDLQQVNTQRIIDYGWPAHLAPPLERLCNICKSMDSWLNSDPNHVVVVHCKGGQDRIAMVIAAFMHYCNICASSDQAMDRFAMKRFYDDKLGGVLRPSQDRYVQYFAGLLSGKIKINSNPLYLHHLVIHGVPNYDTKGGCRPFIKVYQGMQAIFTSGVYNVTDQMQKVCISISPGIPLRGDIMIKCFHKHANGNREPMWTTQFHTCAISNMSILFAKNELDEANNDPRFPSGGKVEFVFGKSQDSRVMVHDFKSDVTVPVVDEDNLKRSESYENFLRSGGVTIDGLIGNTSTNTNQYHIRSNEPTQQSYNTSSNTMKSSYSTSSTLPKKTATVDEQKELDMILSDLLNDQVFVSSPQSPPKSSHTSSNETRTFRTYDTERGPDGKVTYRTAEVNYKLPEQQSYSYTTKTFNESNKTSYVPPNAFSYTPTSPELARRTETSKSTTLPYSVRTDYDHQNGDQFSYSRSETENSSWLQQQKQKLRERKDSKSEERQQQEKQLVDELRTAQNKYYTKRAQNEADEHAVMNSFQNNMSPPPMSNGPTGSYSYSMKKTHSYSTEKTPEPVVTYPTGETSYSTTTYRTESRSNKPPPSPGQQRTNIQINVPVSPPIRSSSKDYMQRSRTSSSSNSWQSSQGQNLYRQNSDNTFDRQSEVILPPVVKTITITTPPPSRRSFSPTNQQSSQKTSYEIHQTVRDQSPDFSKSLPRYSPTKTKVTEIQETNLPEGDKKSHYITEVYVHRTAADAAEPPVQHHRTKSVERTERTEFDKSRSLDELEKSLQAASNSIIATKPTWQPQPQQHQQKVEQTQRITRKYETRTYETHQQQQQESQRQEVQAPRPKHINVVEEDRFSLRPIGPGMQPLEPEGIQTGTLPRSTTPSFPVSPVASAATPPFPITPRSPYYTMQASHQQNQQQQQQQQVTETKEYRYKTHNYSYNQPQQQQQQQMVTSSQHQQHNMVDGGLPQNIPIQHQQSGSQFNTMSSQGSVSSPQGYSTLGSNQSYHTQSQEKYHTMGSTSSQDRFGTMGSQNFNTMSSGQQFGTMGSQNGGLHVDTSHRSMQSGPSSAGSPHSPETLNALRQQLHVAHNMSSSSGGALSPGPHSMTGQSSPSVYFGMSRRGSLTSLADTADAIHATPKFVKSTSKYWYMPNITREEAIQMLKDKAPGTFVVRDSNSFPGAFGLALKVAQIPPNVQTKSSGDPAADLVRHFLIEPTPKGVRLRGCSNEPVFGSLASLVYQHSITPLALPCKLVLPEVDPSVESSMDVSHSTDLPSSAAALLAQGAACNVLYINSIDTESLTGPQAVARALKITCEHGPPPPTTVVHFKVSNQGITLTDNQRKLFFRRHYPVSAVTYCGMDPEGRKWKRDADIAGVQLESRVFGFVARKHSGASDNACHLFAELDPEQPASAIVNFVTKIMIGQSSKK